MCLASYIVDAIVAVPVIAMPAIGVPVVILLVANVSLLYWLFAARLIVVLIFGVDHIFILVVSLSSSSVVVPTVAVLVFLRFPLLALFLSLRSCLPSSHLVDCCFCF